MINDINGKGINDATKTHRPSNAAAIAANHIFGVSHLTKLSIVVEGKQIKHYKHFSLSQSSNKHHNFQLILAHDSLGSPEDHHLEKAQKLMGKRILVTFSYKNIASGSPERDFIGVVTKVSLTRAYGNHGHVVLKGSSPTILMDAAPHIQSFGGSDTISLSAVATSIIQEGIGDKYSHRVAPKFTNNLLYTCQYNETHYNYLARMAAIYGEQFYYDGTTLHFGTLPTPEKAIPLTFGKDVEEVEIQMQARYVKHVMYGYNSSNNELLTTGETQIKHQGALAKKAYSISEKTYLTPSLQIAPLYANTSKDIASAQEAATGNEAANVMITSGKTTVPFLYPGCIVDMNMRKADSAESSFLTRLMITKIEHSVDELGHYSGHFEGIAEGSNYLPAIDFKVPNPESQIATVVNNIDSQGRVQVKFDWQTSGETSQWIRVLSPDAGNSDNVAKNRGFVFIPEIKDQVLIGFVNNNPDHPYVMGGLFHGANGAGGFQENHLKTITTRSGCIIQIDDSENEGSITIKDPSGNTWHMDGNENITVSAPNNININAGKDINLSAGENLNLSVGQDMNTNVGNNKTLNVERKQQVASQTYIEKVQNDKTVTIGGDLDETTSSTKHRAKRGDLLLQSNGVSKLLGAIDAKVNKG